MFHFVNKLILSSAFIMKRVAPQSKLCSKIKEKIFFKNSLRYMSGSGLNKLETLPIDDGFIMPAEWSKHQMCWMGFPYAPANWRGNGSFAQKAFVQVATAISEFEPVTMCTPPHLLEKCIEMCPKNITVLPMEQNDSWFRDTGPTFLKKGPVIRGVDWIFNAWGGIDGGCYSDWSDDKLIAEKILSYCKCDRYPADLILEGGSIHTDGEGTIITTEECLLNRNRNPTLTKAQIEKKVLSYTGCKKMIWLPLGLFGDVDTNGHVDNICAFIRPAEVVLCWTDDVNDPQYEISRKAEEVLLNSEDAKGRKLKIHKIPMPTTLIRTQEEVDGLTFEDGTIKRFCGRMPGSYVNFYLGNGGIVLPKFNVPTDDIVVEIFKKIMPDYKIVSVESREILLGGGNIHCITQQMPI